MVVIMNYKKYSYYYDTIIYLIAGYKPFQEKVSRIFLQQMRRNCVSAVF